MVHSILIFLLPVMVFMCVNSVFRQVLLAMERRRFVMIEGTFIVIFNIVLSIILMQFMDVMGLAVGTSATAILDCGLMVYYFRRETGRFPQTGTAIFLLKILSACLVMAVCVWFFAERVGESIPAGRGLYQGVFIAGSAFIGATLYFLSARIFRAFRLTDPMNWAG
jgi:putative peptidoglycan lipid II flippase